MSAVLVSKYQHEEYIKPARSLSDTCILPQITYHRFLHSTATERERCSPQCDGRIPKGIGRVSVVNEKLELVYDTFVHYGDRPHRPDPQFLNLGVKYKDIKPENGA